MPRAHRVIDRVMDRRFVIALLLVAGAASVLPPSQVMAASEGDNRCPAGQNRARMQRVKARSLPAAPDISFSDYDSQAEEQLLDLANQARTQAGAPRLTLDAGLCRAARAHAEAMFAARQLSHQFDGEPSLPPTRGSDRDRYATRSGRRECRARFRRRKRASTPHAVSSASRQPAQSGLQRDRVGRGAQRRPSLHCAGFRPCPPQLFSGGSEGADCGDGDASAASGQPTQPQSAFA